MLVRWAVVTVNGERDSGAGKTQGLSSLMLRSAAAVLRHPKGPPIYVAGAFVLAWTVERELGRDEEERYWRVLPNPGAELIVWPDGSKIGVGKSVEDVERAIKLLEG